MTNNLTLARRLSAAGLSPLPIKTDGSKSPDLSRWTEFQKRQATDAELARWFDNGVVRGVAVVCGAISGHLEVIDFDAPELIGEWRELVEEAVPGLLDRLPQVETPRAGLHVYYRCDLIEGNRKLAMRADDGGKVQTLIETRGNGGYVLTAGCPAACHPTGKLYRLINGNLELVPTITKEEREILLTCARALNQYVKPSQQIAPERETKKASGLKPGKEFNQRGDVRALLEKHGWKRLRRSRAGELWQRPDGTHTSATLFDNGNLYVFSSNAHPFENDCSYSPFAILATLEHNGDFGATAKALAAEGYGEPAAPKDAKKPTKKALQVGNVHFEVSDSGVWSTDEDDNKTWICSRLEIEADTRDETNRNWGRLLKFSDRDGVVHQWAMPMQLLSGDGREYREEMLNQGLVMAQTRNARSLLGMYLNTKPEKKALCVTKQGWHRGAFVLPDETIGENGEPIYLQTLSANHPFQQSGTVEEWRDQVGQYCAGNKRLVLAASIAFAAPLLEPLSGESGGWHFTGGSSKGKTTTLYVAGSIHGGGSDKGFIRRWRATINGLETVAETHHDALLCLDEIAECKPDDVNEAAYMLANGQGKARQGRTGGLRSTLTWRVVFLSSGEVSIAEHVAQTGKRIRAGQEVRVINLPADAGTGYGLFEELHGFANGDDFARYLQRASRDSYGAPIRQFLRNVAGKPDKLRADYKTFETELLGEMLPKDAASEVSRVAHRFVLAAFAGEQATNLGITGWQPDEATEAAKALFQIWIDARGTIGSSDEEAAMRQVRKFIEQHGQSRFQRIRQRPSASGEIEMASDERTIVNRAGFLKENPDGEGWIYCILPEVFRSEVCAGFDSKRVANWLNDRNWLLTNDKLQYKVRTPDGLTRTYSLLGCKILD